MVDYKPPVREWDNFPKKHCGFEKCWDAPYETDPNTLGFRLLMKYWLGQMVDF